MIQLRSAKGSQIKQASLAEVIKAAVDVYHAHHPELMVSEVLDGLVEIHNQILTELRDQTQRLQ